MHDSLCFHKLKIKSLSRIPKIVWTFYHSKLKYYIERCSAIHNSKLWYFYYKWSLRIFFLKTSGLIIQMYLKIFIPREVIDSLILFLDTIYLCKFKANYFIASVWETNSIGSMIAQKLQYYIKIAYQMLRWNGTLPIVTYFRSK